ncbi:MAG: hypothetical protein ACI31R_02715, partial [Bacilli bacterium]
NSMCLFLCHLWTLTFSIYKFCFFIMMFDRLGRSLKVMQDTYMHLFPTIQDEVVDLVDNL